MTDIKSNRMKKLAVVPQRSSHARHVFEQTERRSESVVTRREFGSAVRAYVGALGLGSSASA
jgi:hypothetical protein